MEVNTNKTRIILLFSISLAFLSAVCIYVNRVDRVHDDEASADNCKTGLDNAQETLEVVMKYKSRTDHLLVASQEFRQKDIDRFDEVMENCFILAQESMACKHELGAMDKRCKKEQGECIIATNQLRLLKSLANETVVT